MHDHDEYRERLRRWGWVSVAIGLPGAGLLAFEGYLMYVNFRAPTMGEVFMVFALLAPLLVGVRMIVSGYRPGVSVPRGGDDGSQPAREAAKRRTSPRVHPSFLLGIAIFLTGLGYLAVPVCGCSTREKAYQAAMRSDLKNLMSQQEIHFAYNDEYSASATDLAFTNSDGVTVHIVATRSGWTAKAWHRVLGEGVGCAAYYGEVDFVLRTGGGTVPTEPGEVMCDEV